MDWLVREQDELALDEGIRLKAYLDTVGVWTIGVGHTGDDVFPGLVIDRAQAMELLDQDIEEAVEDAEVVCDGFWEDLSGPRKGVMTNMAFNLGRKCLAGFKNTLKLVASGQYEKAASNMMLSKWSKQVGKRSNRLAHRMATNQYAAR